MRARAVGSLLLRAVDDRVHRSALALLHPAGARLGCFMPVAFTGCPARHGPQPALRTRVAAAAAPAARTEQATGARVARRTHAPPVTRDSAGWLDMGKRAKKWCVGVAARAGDARALHAQDGGGDSCRAAVRVRAPLSGHCGFVMRGSL